MVRRAVLVRIQVLVLALLCIVWTRPARAGEVAMLPSPEGYFGAWLALGAINATIKGSPPRTMDANLSGGDDESALVGRLGRAGSISPSDATVDLSNLRWKLVAAGASPIDLAEQLPHRGAEAFAFLYGTLHLSEPLRGLLLIGASDGVRVWIDKKQVWSNDSPRPERDDEDIVRLDLAAGDHPIVMKLHHHEGYWAVRVRVVDSTFAPPRGAFLKLPGSSDADARALAQKMVEVDIAQGIAASGFRPSVSVSFPGGLPRGTERMVRVSAAARAGDRSLPLFSLDAGQVPLSYAGLSRFRVQLPPIGRTELAPMGEEGELTLRVNVAGKNVDSMVPLRSSLQRAAAAADRALALIDGEDGFLGDHAVTRATLEHLRERLASYVDGGAEAAGEGPESDAQRLVDFEADLQARHDPLRSRAGIRRFAYRSSLDDQLSPFGVYLPPSYVRAPPAGKTYPLVIVLHGLNGKPLSMLGWFFGRDQQGRDPEWEDRHVGDVEPVEGFVIAPNGYGNALYRELGEVDVMNVLDWAMRFFPIDKNRVTITGASMGGTGAASIAFRYPDKFAAAEPLCGYHSYFIRKDVGSRGLFRWEQPLAEQRSNTMWADNGLYLPLYIWHGKRDWPEQNSGVLIERYQALGYGVEHEHPDVGHDVWKLAYQDRAGFAWLSQKVRPEHKPRILFKSDSPRYRDHGWVHLTEFAPDLEFATIDARVVEPTLIEVTTRKVEGFSLDRDPKLVSAALPTRVNVDGTSLVFEPTEPMQAYLDDGRWKSGARERSASAKRAGLSGPMRDVFFEPLVFVYGTGDPAQTRVNRETARAWARIRWGVDARYSIIADVDLTDEIAGAHSLVLVGNASSNRALREIESELPFRIAARTITAGIGSARKRVFRGADIGVGFVYPNPRHPARYVLVLEGTTALGTFRSIALPDMLPDFAVFDERIAAARGQNMLGSASLLWGGLFRDDWSFRPGDLAR